MSEHERGGVRPYAAEPPVDPGPGPGVAAYATARSVTAPSASGWRALLPRDVAELVAAGALLVGLAVIGVLAGFGWEQISPRVTYTIVARGQGAADEVSEAAFGAEGWFVLIGLAIGAVAGVAVWFVRRARGPLVLLALGGAALLGAYIAYRVGLGLDTPPTKADTARLFGQVGARLQTPLRLRAKVTMLAEPAAAVVAYMVCLGASSWELRRRSDRRWWRRLRGRTGPGDSA